MKKNDLALKISKQVDLPRIDVLIIIETFFKEVRESLLDGVEVRIHEVGRFQLQHRKARIGRNIRKGVEVHIPARTKPIFRFSKKWKDDVKNLRGELIRQGRVKKNPPTEVSGFSSGSKI